MRRDHLTSPIEQEIRALIRRHGRITFAQFMRTCLYSPRGGFYSSRADRINAHFGTSSTSHPVFGTLIARQLEEMWHLLGCPEPFHVIEAGCGDGSLARSITSASTSLDPQFARALFYVAADYEPRWPSPGEYSTGFEQRYDAAGRAEGKDPVLPVHRVKGEGMQPFRHITGCILSNELLDNFPVHRFVIQDGEVMEVFVALVDDTFIEATDRPSTRRIEQRLESLGITLPNGFRGEVNLAIEDWSNQLAEALDRGFILSIDYGEPAPDLYSARNSQGTVVCFNQHVISADPYQHVGQQDITAHVDFTSLATLGERRGLRTVGYTVQRDFLENLGFSAFLDSLEAQGLSHAHTELRRIAMMTLVDPEEYGNLKVLAQAKGIDAGAQLLGFD